MSATSAITATDREGLRRAVAAAGAFERCPRLTVLKFAAHAIVGSALYALCLVAPLGLALALTPLCALALVVGVMIGHDATHGAVFASSRANAVLRCLAFPFLSGMSSIYWRYKHNVLHHQRPNTPDHDQDLEVLPFAVGRSHHDASPRGFRWFQRRFQRGWMFWLLSPLLSWDLRVRGVRYLAGEATRRDTAGARFADWAMIVAHVLVFVALPAFIVGPVRVIAIHLVVWSFAGSWLTLVGLVGHSGRPLVTSSDDRWAQQFHATRDLRLGPVLSWCFAGLDRQIEHHLFPQVPHLRLARAEPAVRAFAQAHDLPYCEARLWPCLREITRYFDQAWDDRGVDLRDGQAQHR